MYKTRRPPSQVMRQLRQECGFGCAQCGCPILEYHHIIEWAEKKHHDPEHMVALCPTCHRVLGKLPRKRAYEVKRNPINIRNKRIKGYLGGTNLKNSILVGGTRVIDCKSAINFSGIDILSYSIVDGEFCVNAFIPDKDYWPEIEIKRSNVSAWIENFWDIEFKTNWIRFRRNQGEIFFSIDFRGDEVTVEGAFQIGRERITLSDKNAKIGGGVLSGVTLQGAGSAIRIGPKGRLIRPNYAMLQPRAFLVP